MPAPVPPLMSTVGPDTDRAASLVACYFVGCGLSLAFVILRFWARLSIKAIGYDDWFTLASWVSFSVCTPISV